MTAIHRYDGSKAHHPCNDAVSVREAQLAQARDERRWQADDQAHRLIAEAGRLAPDEIIPHTLQLLSQTLGVDHVTLAVGPEARPRAVFYANSRGATAVSWSDLRTEAEPLVSLQVKGAVSRLHAFVYRAGDAVPDGCLSLHSMQPRSFRAPEIALADALAELLGREFERSRVVGAP
jgi:hypothetical protein